MTLQPVTLLACPDDYLLELEREQIVSAWREACADGEVIHLDAQAGVSRIVQECITPSLFSGSRLVLADASALVGRSAKDAAPLAEAVASCSWRDVSLLLVAVTSSAPDGPLAEAVGRVGRVRWIPLPEPPKPWEEVRLSGPQRAALEGVVRRVAPDLLRHRDVMDALLDVHGFHPRELAQAAEALQLSGEVSAAAVRASAGAGECALADLEKSLTRRDRAALAAFFAVLASGGRLLGFRGEAVGPDGYGQVLTGTVGRLLRHALAMRGHARAAGLERQLDPRACSGRGWYSSTFKARLLPAIEATLEAAPESPLKGMSAWQLHHKFRLAAAYPDAALLRALAALSGCGAERARGGEAVGLVTPVVLSLVSAPSK